MGNRDKIKYGVLEEVIEETVEEELTTTLEVDDVVEYDVVEEVVTERVQLLYPAKVKRTGQSSGQHYVWEKPGDIVEVFKEDVPALMLSKIGGRSCCAGSPGRNGNYLFRVV